MANMTEDELMAAAVALKARIEHCENLITKSRDRYDPDDVDYWSKRLAESESALKKIISQVAALPH
jgi:hypothetical protein